MHSAAARLREVRYGDGESRVGEPGELDTRMMEGNGTCLLVEVAEEHLPPAVEARAHLLGVVRRRLVNPLADSLREVFHACTINIGRGQARGVSLIARAGLKLYEGRH